MGAIAVILGFAAGTPNDLRLALAASGIALAAGLATRAGPGLIYLLLIWVALMGTVRRLLDGSAVANQADPLLLIAVAAIVVLTVVGGERGAFRPSSRLATAVVLFNLLTVFGALNPLQGSVTSGITGLVFFLVPSLAFWIGRGLLDDHVLSRALPLVGGLAVLAGIYGLIQTFGSFPSWDARWIQNSGYASLDVNRSIRAFGSFASSQEYALYLGVGVVIWAAYGFRSKRVVLSLAACGLLAVGIFYESSRTPLVTTVFAIGLVAAATKIRNPLVVAVFGVVAVALIPFVVSHLTSNTTNPYAGGLAGHQVSGLAHPFSSQSSTLAGHLGEVTKGFRIMLHHPLGVGISVVNIAGSKIAGVANNTEYDPSNVAIALGVPGLLLYVVILIEGFRLAMRRVAARRDFVSKAALGIVAVTVLQWTNGGLYSVAFLPWLMMGWLDREAVNSREAAALPVSDALPALTGAVAVS